MRQRSKLLTALLGALLTVPMLVLGSATSAQAVTGLEFTLASNQGRAGSTIHITPVDNCPASEEDGYRVLLTLTDSANATFEERVFLNPDGTWPLYGSQLDWQLPFKQHSGYFGNEISAEPAQGAGQITAQCIAGTQAVGEYDPVAFTITGPSRQMSVSDTTLAVGDDLTITPTDGCPEALSYEALTISDTSGSGNYESIPLTEGGTPGSWQPVVFTIPSDWHTGHYYVALTCYVEYNGGYEYHYYSEVMLRISGTHDYVALGDSFSSGEGVEPFDPDTETAGPPENRCHRSTLAYAHLLDQDANLPFALREFRACSGATTHHVQYGGQWENEPEQLVGLGIDTDVLTITIGGNDIGFAEFATACVVPWDTCVGSAHNDAMDKIEEELPDKLDAAYAAIGGLVSPDTRILVVGYPRIIPYTNQEVVCSVLDEDEQVAAQQVTVALNQAIDDAVDRADNRFEYVHADHVLNGVRVSPFATHEFCTEDSYFNGVDLVNREYSLHPNANGQEAYATLITTYLTNNP